MWSKLLGERNEMQLYELQNKFIREKEDEWWSKKRVMRNTGWRDVPLILRSEERRVGKEC